MPVETLDTNRMHCIGSIKQLEEDICIFDQWELAIRLQKD